MSRKIAFINQSTGYLMIDIINNFVKEYDQVVLISGRVMMQHVPLDNRVKVSKIISYNTASVFTKAFSWFMGTIQIYFLLFFKYNKYDVFYVTNPPTAYLLSNFLKNKFFVLVYDVYPDTFKIIGMAEHNIIYKYWTRLNKRVFLKAERIFTLSEGMADLLNRYVPIEKVTVIPNWSSIDSPPSVEKKENKFILENNLLNKFIVLYAGNIGHTHNVEVLVDVAKRLENQDDLLFLITSKGSQVEIIRKKVVNDNVRNFRIIPFQPEDMVPFLLATADIGVVTLDDKTASVSLPSKIYNLMAVGVPLLCIASKDSDMNKLISKYSIGSCFDKSDIEGMVEFILRLKEDKGLLDVYRNNSRNASKNFTMDNAKVYLNYV